MGYFFALIAPVAGLHTEFLNYWHFPNISMDASASPGGCSGIWDTYSTPGCHQADPRSGCSPLGINMTSSDLELAKHVCDRYSDCQYFNGWQGSGWPGAIGRYYDCPTYDTFIKMRGGAGVESGSLYFPETEYLRIPKHVNTECRATARMNTSTPDQIHQACEALASCDGFILRNGAAGGVLCEFNDSPGCCDSFLKLPVPSRAVAEPRQTPANAPVHSNVGAAFPGYITWSNLTMQYSPDSPPAAPGLPNYSYACNEYPTPGAGKEAMNDADLAMHICDQYDRCKWFNGCNSSKLPVSTPYAYPGCIGFWLGHEMYDTHLKQGVVKEIVNGSLYSSTRYARFTGMNAFCLKQAEYSEPPDMIKLKCDAEPKCDGFSARHDATSGFTCQLDRGHPECDSHLKMDK